MVEEQTERKSSRSLADYVNGVRSKKPELLKSESIAREIITNTNYDTNGTNLFELTQDVRLILESAPQETRVVEKDNISLEISYAEQNGSTVEQPLSNVGQKTNSSLKVRKSFLLGRRNPILRDYIAQVLQNAEEAKEIEEEELEGLSPTEVTERVRILGYETKAIAERSFYNTVFQALNRYPDLFVRLEEGCRYKLVEYAEPEKSIELNGKELRRKSLRKVIIGAIVEAEQKGISLSGIATELRSNGYWVDLEQRNLEEKLTSTISAINRDCKRIVEKRADGRYYSIQQYAG